jgi:hypothetical protein
VFVNGKGPFTFLYDTGSSYTIVSNRVVDAARPTTIVDRKRHRDLLELDQIQVGGVALEKVWAINDDSFGVDGILGFPAFGEANVLIDMNSRKLTVSELPIELNHSFSLPYEAPFNVPTIPVTFGSRTVQTLIDTGDDAYALEMKGTELQGVRFTQPPVIAGSVMNGANLQEARVAKLEDPVRLGPCVAYEGVIAINDDLPIGDLGYEVLRQFTIVIEPRKSEVAFQPVFTGNHFDIPGKRSIGFTVSFIGEHIVTGVVPDSAADRAGLKKNARVLSIGHIAADAVTPKSWDQMLRTQRTIKVRWMADGRLRSATLPVKTLR